MTTDWHDHAACATTDPALFFADRSNARATRSALAICRSCEVRGPCLVEAVQQETEFDSGQHVYGIRGGMTAADRLRLRSGRAK